MKKVDAPTFIIEHSFLYSQFPHLARSVRELRTKWEAANGPISMDRDTYVGTRKPLKRPEDPSLEKEKTPASEKVYSWWGHLPSYYGYPPAATLSSPLLPNGFNYELWLKWERHLISAVARVGALECISWIENGVTLRHMGQLRHLGHMA